MRLLFLDCPNFKSSVRIHTSEQNITVQKGAAQDN